MKKLTLLFFIIYIWSYSIFNAVNAKADDYNNAVVGHVITQVIQGVDVDHSELLEAELERIAYKGFGSVGSNASVPGFRRGTASFRDGPGRW